MPPVLADARALNPEYVPETLHGRTSALDSLRAGLTPIKRGVEIDPVCLFGPSGTGKTTLAKHIVRQLAQSILDLRWGYVDAMTHSSAHGVVYQLCTALGIGSTRQRRGTSRGTLLDRLREHDNPMIAIVDEASFLSDQSILATLNRITGLTVFAVTIDEHSWFNSIKQDVGRRIRPSATVQLDPYGPDELRTILEERARVGLAPGVIDDSAIEAIAMLAEGDARFAIALLRRGAREVMNDAARRITPAVIERVEEDARDTIRDRQRQQLGTYQRVLYDIVRDAGEIRAERLHERFCEAVDDDSPPAKRTRNRYLRSLREYDMIELDGRGRAASYSVV